MAPNEGEGHYDEAELWRRKWLAVVREKDGSDSVEYARELTSLGSLLLRQKKHSDAETALREGLAIILKMQSGTLARCNAQSLLGAALIGQHKYTEAEPILTQCYSGLKKLEMEPGHMHSGYRQDLSEVAELLVSLHDSCGQPDKAEKWRAERAKYPPSAAPIPREVKR